MDASMNSILTSTILLVVVFLVNSVYAQNLFPPVEATENFALQQASFATSTCGMCEDGELGCTLCNSSCPYERQVPEPMNLLEAGALASGVAQTNLTSVDDAPIYEFSGNEESYVSFLEDLSFQPSQGFTFAAWVQQDQGNDGYVFAKTTVSGITSFYALYLNSEGQSATFEYRHEGLEEGFRTIFLTEVNLVDGRFHHIAVSVYGRGFALYVDGQLHGGPRMLIASLEDGVGVFFLGRRQGHLSRFSGLMHSVFYFNSTLSDNNIATLAGAASDPVIQPECQCPPTHSIVLQHECQDLLGSSRIPRINLAAHDATYINDGDTMTWWQSSNGEAPVNVTVGLGGLRAALVVVVQFNSLLPRAMVLHYSTDGNMFYPRQYYAADCSYFSLPDNGPLSMSTDVNCVTSNSLPLENQYVEFRVLDTGNRPGAEDYYMNSDLQVFAQATHVQLELFAWNTDVLADQHFAVNEVMVYGQACVCNGHATVCDGATCICEQNTTGTHCEDCLEGYFKTSLEVCAICECNVAGTIGGSNACNRVTGQCPCEPNVVGLDCSSCAPGYYGDVRNASCLPCDDQCLECTGPGLTNCVSYMSRPESTSELTAMFGTSVSEIATSFVFLETSTIGALESPEVISPVPSSDGFTPGPSTVPILPMTTPAHPHASQIAITPFTATPSIIPLHDSSTNLLIPRASTTLEAFESLEFISMTFSDLLPERSTQIAMKFTVLPTSSPLQVQVSTFFQTILGIPTSHFVEPTPTFTASLNQAPSRLLLPSIAELSTVMETPFVVPTVVDELFRSTSLPEIQLSMTPQLSLISDFILQPSTELLLPAHPTVTLMLPIAGPSTMQPVTLQPSAVETSSNSPNLLLPLPSSKLLILSEASIVLPASAFVLDESSLPLELFPSTFLPESQPAVTSIIRQTTLSEIHVIVTSSDVTELTVSPQPSEVTLFVSQSLSLFPQVATEIVPESAMLPEQVSPILTPFPPLTPLFLSLTPPMEPSSPPPAPLSSPIHFTSLLLTPQILSTSPVGITPSAELQLETSTTLFFPHALPSMMVEPPVSSPTGDIALSISEFIVQPSSGLLLSAHPSLQLILPIASSLDTTPTFQATSTMQPATLQSSIPIPTVVTSSESPNLLFSLDLPILSETTFLLPTSVLVLDEMSLPLELFPSTYFPDIQATVTSTIPQTALSDTHVIVTSDSDIAELTVTPQPSEVTLSVLQLLATQSLSLFLEVESEEPSMLPEQASPIPTPFTSLPPLTPLFLSLTSPMEQSSPPPAPLSSPLLLFPFTSFLITPQLPSTTLDETISVPAVVASEVASPEQVSPIPTPFPLLTPFFMFFTSPMEPSSTPPAPLSSPIPFPSFHLTPQILSTSPVGITPSTELQLNPFTTLFPLPSTMVEPLVSSPTGDIALSISEFIVQPSTQLLVSATNTILQPSTALLISQELASTMQPVTLQLSIPSPTVVADSESPNLLLPLPSSELPILSKASFVLPTSAFVLDESSLPLELFPSFLSELQATVTPQTTLTDKLSSSEIAEQTVSPQPTDSPQPSEITASVSQPLATQSLSLFPEVATEIVPESAMLPEQDSPIPTPFPPLTPLFLSLTSPMEPFSPPPAHLSSPMVLFPFTSFLLSPQILSTSPVGISPSTGLQLETSTTLLLFPLPSTMVEPPVSSPTGNIALSISEFIVQPSSGLLSAHPSLLPIESSLDTTPTFQATSTLVQSSTVSEELPSMMQPATLQPSILIPTVNVVTSSELLLPLPSSELPIPTFLRSSSVFLLDESSLPLELFPSSDPTEIQPTVTSTIPQTTLSDTQTSTDLDLTVSPQPSEITLSVLQLLTTQSLSLFPEVATEIIPESAMLPEPVSPIPTPFTPLPPLTPLFLSQVTSPIEQSTPSTAPLSSPLLLFPLTSFLITPQLPSTTLFDTAPLTSQPILQLETSTGFLFPLLSMIEPQASLISLPTSMFLPGNIASSVEVFPTNLLPNIQPTLTSQPSMSEPPTSSDVAEVTSEIVLFSSDIASLPLESFFPEATAVIVPESIISPPSRTTAISSLESSNATSNIALLLATTIAMTAGFLIPSPTLEGLLSETPFLFSTMFDEMSFPLELVPSTSLPEMQPTIASSIPQLTESGIAELTASISVIVSQQPESLLFAEVTTGLHHAESTNLLLFSDQPSSSPTLSTSLPPVTPSLFSTLEQFFLPLPTPSSHTLALFLSTSSFEDTASPELTPMPSSDQVFPEISSELNLTPVIPISTLQRTSFQEAILLSMTQTVSIPALTEVPSTFSKPFSSELRSHIELPTTSGIAQPTTILVSGGQEISSITQHTSVPAVISTMVPSPVSSVHMTSQLSAPVKISPTSVVVTTVPMSVAESPLPTPAPTLVPFACPPPVQVSSTVDSLVNIVLALTITEHSELAINRSARQCMLEEALAVVYNMGLQLLEDSSQGRKKRQLQNNGNYATEITEMGPLSSGQSTITFYIINVTAALPLAAADVVQAFQAANPQEIDTYPVITQAFAHTLEGTESTLIPTVTGVVGSVLLALLVAVTCVGLLWAFRNNRKHKYTPRDAGGEAGTIPTNDFVAQPIGNHYRPYQVTSIGGPSHTGVQSASETIESPSLQGDQVPAECVAHYDTSPALPCMQPKFREIVALPPSTTQEASQEEYADGGVYSGSVQGQKLYDDGGRIQEERDKQELKARRKATYKRFKHGSVGKRKSHLPMLPHSQERRKLTFEDTDAPFPSATPISGLPGSPHHTTIHPFTRLNRVGPLRATTHGGSHRLSRNQHGHEEPFSRLSTTGRLPRGIAHGVKQELAWMQTGDGVQLLQVQPLLTEQQPRSAHPLSAWEQHERFLGHTQTTPNSISHHGSRLGTSGEAEEASPGTSDPVQDLVREAFSLSPALTHPPGGNSGGLQQQTSTAMSLNKRSTLPQQRAFTDGTPAAAAQQRPASQPSHVASPPHMYTCPQYTSQELIREAFRLSPSLAHPVPDGSSRGLHQQNLTAMSFKEQSTLPQQQPFTHSTPAVAWQRTASLPREAASPSPSHTLYTPQPVDYAEDMGQLVWTPPSSAQTQLRSHPNPLGLQSYPNPLNTPFHDHEPQSHPAHTP